MYRFKEFLRIYFTLAAFASLLLLFQNCAEPLDPSYIDGSNTTNSVSTDDDGSFEPETTVGSNNVVMNRFRRYLNTTQNTFFVGPYTADTGNDFLRALDGYEIFNSSETNTKPLYVCKNNDFKDFSLTTHALDCASGTLFMPNPIGYISQVPNATYNQTAALHLCYSATVHDHKITTSYIECKADGYEFSRLLGFVKVLDASTIVDAHVFLIAPNNTVDSGITFFDALFGVYVTRCTFPDDRTLQYITTKDHCNEFPTYSEQNTLGMIAGAPFPEALLDHPVYRCVNNVSYFLKQKVTLDRSDCTKGGFNDLNPEIIGYSRPK